jgi:hypothetical protein
LVSPMRPPKRMISLLAAMRNPGTSTTQTSSSQYSISILQRPGRAALWAGVPCRPVAIAATRRPLLRLSARAAPPCRRVASGPLAQDHHVGYPSSTAPDCVRA